MGDEITPIESRVYSISQDYILMGKSTKETEIKIYVDGNDYEGSRKKVENVMRLTAYANAVNNGVIALPKYNPAEKPEIKVES